MFYTQCPAKSLTTFKSINKWIISPYSSLFSQSSTPYQFSFAVSFSWFWINVYAQCWINWKKRERRLTERKILWSLSAQQPLTHRILSLKITSWKMEKNGIFDHFKYIVFYFVDIEKGLKSVDIDPKITVDSGCGRRKRCLQKIRSM